MKLLQGLIVFNLSLGLESKDGSWKLLSVIINTINYFKKDKTDKWLFYYLRNFHLLFLNFKIDYIRIPHSGLRLFKITFIDVRFLYPDQ
ncbi:hypothetical protein HX13_15395 [Chryseobacterium sp. P1-3]|nr:hypothetical protein HX13_15395 [Chryseobacterium sp. P1-3]